MGQKSQFQFFRKTTKPSTFGFLVLFASVSNISKHVYVCVCYSCESIVNSSDAFPEHPNMKRTRPTDKQTLGCSSPASVDYGSDSLQPCSLDSNSLLPPPCTSGVGRKSPGEQNILPVPPCSSQAFLGEPEDRTVHLLTAYRVSFGLLRKDSVPSHSHAPIQNDDPKSSASSIFCKSLTMGAELGKEG